MNKWQNRWNNTVDKVQWTRRITPDIRKWNNVDLTEIDFFTTHSLTGHGCVCLKRIGKSEFDTCFCCGQEDDVEHTDLVCLRWEVERMRMEVEIGDACLPDNLLEKMTESKDVCKKIIAFLRGIIVTKFKKLQREN